MYSVDKGCSLIRIANICSIRRYGDDNLKYVYMITQYVNN